MNVLYMHKLWIALYTNDTNVVKRSALVNGLFLSLFVVVLSQAFSSSVLSCVKPSNQGFLIFNNNAQIDLF